ncbi:MAG TPA: ABC transporter substrate-binding protein [Thermomicrobiales bacterium]|nr:ABC transporter substrate-binding protein [Thermomicrobiales bacterium]
MSQKNTFDRPVHMSRRTLLKGSAAAGLAASVGGSLLGFNPLLVVAQDAERQGGEFKTGAAQDAVSMHPFKETDTASFSYIDLVNWLPLLRYNPETIELEPFAAESFEESEDHKTITFVLKQDLVWSDGEALTANDYAWTWEQASNEDNGWPRLGNYSPFVDSVTATDDHTIEVVLKETIATSLEKAVNALAYVLPQHIWEDLDWSDPEANPEIMKPSVSAGPFVMTEWKKDQYATFEANDSFMLGRPNFDTYMVQLFGQDNIALQALLEGQIDQYGPSAESWEDAQNNDKLNALQWDAPDNAVMYFGFNCRQEMFQDAKVRQALNFAFDKDIITQELTYGLGARATGMYLPTSWAYNPDAETFAYDVDKAKSLLDEAGWVEGDGGIREKDGQKLKFQFIYGPNNDPIREQMATVAQQMWGEVGADVEVLGMEWGAYLTLTKEGPYDWGVFMNMYIPAIDPDLIWFKKDAGPSYNRVGYDNDRVHELYEQGLLEFDREKREQIYQEIMGILTEESPWMWIYSEQGHSAINTRVQGVEINNLGLNDVWEWSIEE